GQMLAFAHGNDRSVMSLTELERLRLDTLRSFYCDSVGPFSRSAMTIAVFVSQRVFRIIELFDKHIHDVGIVYGTAPTEILIVADRRIRRAKERCAAQIPAFAAVNV